MTYDEAVDMVLTGAKKMQAFVSNGVVLNPADTADIRARCLQSAIDLYASGDWGYAPDVGDDDGYDPRFRGSQDPRDEDD